ncbi:cactin-like [Aethina tumida]|uniref:cactin-like n=1 Tax=Aethina tumida TaxID=116153 RepID=UPI00096B0180|nr:cactin-like [Aethina tumida]
MSSTENLGFYPTLNDSMKVPYEMFVQDFIRAHAGLRVDNILKLALEVWKILNNEDKLPYYQRAREKSSKRSRSKVRKKSRRNRKRKHEFSGPGPDIFDDPTFFPKRQRISHENEIKQELLDLVMVPVNVQCNDEVKSRLTRRKSSKGRRKSKKRSKGKKRKRSSFAYSFSDNEKTETDSKKAEDSSSSKRRKRSSKKRKKKRRRRTKSYSSRNTSTSVEENGDEKSGDSTSEKHKMEKGKSAVDDQKKPKGKTTASEVAKQQELKKMNGNRHGNGGTKQENGKPL